MIFVNRTKELALLERSSGKLVVLFGRRRIGKTTLVEKWISGRPWVYSQAIEGNANIQIAQLRSDLASILPEGLVPRSWAEFFGALALIKEEIVLVIDEFPYLLNSSPDLASRLQNWIDRQKDQNGVRLVLLGSSQSMMYETFLDSRSALYERAEEIVHLQPLNFRDFCEAKEITKPTAKDFELFSIVGGVPKYWEFVKKRENQLALVDRLFFEKSARLAFEPDRLLKDEHITGQQAKSILECVGRGAIKASEIASRLGIRQSSLSGPLRILQDTALLGKDTPFSEQEGKSKRALYYISDYPIRFWFRVYSPHRSRWPLLDARQQQILIHEHASGVLEREFIKQHPGASRYWEGSLEFDCVRHHPTIRDQVIISEIKHKNLTSAERDRIGKSLKENFQKSRLAKKFKLGGAEVLDTRDVICRLVQEGG